MWVFEQERGVESPRRQTDDDQRLVDDLGLRALVYGWRPGRTAEPLPFQPGHHAWELYRLPELAAGTARDALARTSRRHAHWLVEWPGRDRVLLRRPPAVCLPDLGIWTRLRCRRGLEQRLRASADAVARLDATLEQVEVLEPLYVERAHLGGRDWTRTVALLPDAQHIAMCPWDWYEFVVADFVESCDEAVARERP